MLGLLLFLVLINEAVFEGQLNNAGDLITRRRNMTNLKNIHLKYVDDMTLAEPINLTKQLISVPASVRPMPDMYHARTGHVLPLGNSEVYKQLLKTEEYARTNHMKLNFKKTKVMLFNPCWSVDFMPQLEVEDHELELVEEMRLLGVIIQSDMKWSANTDHIVKKASSKLWVIKRLKALGASPNQLVDMYIKQCRSILELAVPAWHGAITQSERADIERVQKGALYSIFGDNYGSYRNALKLANLNTLEARRDKLCSKFAKKAENNTKHKNWFKPKPKICTRQSNVKYCKVIARTDRFKNSPICHLTSVLNNDKKK